MRCIFAVSGILLGATGLTAGQSWVTILPDYVVVGITRIGAEPADVVVESADGFSQRSQVGRYLGDLTIEDVVNLDGEWFVEVRRDGMDYLLARKRPQEAPFQAGPLADAFNAGMIGRDGRLTSEGRNAIAQNLLIIANAAHYYTSHTGADQADLARMAEDGFFEMDQLTPVIGEDYSQITVSRKGGAIMTRTVFGEVVRWAY